MIKTLYEQTNFPVLQNRVYEAREAAIHCARGDIDIVEAQTTGLKVMSSDTALKLYPINAPVYVMNSNYLDEIWR